MLGGSFYPPHNGHIEISNLAIKKLNLDEIWWLTAVKHPFKNFINEKNFLSRIEKTKKFINNPKIKIIINKKFLINNYSIKNLRKIIEFYQNTNFIWIMGADNLLTFHKWYKWKEIFKLLPIAVFDRPKFSNISLSSISAIAFSKNRYSEKASKKLYSINPPAWIFLHEKLNYLKSEKIRNRKE